MSESAIVLCGGRSRRMGRDKWSLPFGHENLLERTVRVVGEVVPEVVVVPRKGQKIEGDYKIARDRGDGPLSGLVAGLGAMEGSRAFLTSCDVPFLSVAYVKRMLEISHGHPIAVPVIDGRHMPTSAVYSIEVLPTARRLLDEGKRRPRDLIDAFDARIVKAEELEEIDPDLQSLRNCNTPEEYAEALEDAGLE